MVAGALNLVGDDAIHGRNWGCDADFKSLHFECCYYQAIEEAIARGLERVEAGAQVCVMLCSGARASSAALMD
jgi:predicted N-acyltransferase